MLVNVFASWCTPCRVEHPKLMALKARGVAVVGVAWKDDPADTRAFLDELGNPYSMVLVDQEGRAGLDLGITGAPETFAVNAMGKVVAKSSPARCWRTRRSSVWWPPSRLRRALCRPPRVAKGPLEPLRGGR
jgi:DsbE subfamily thiol:disulfide oxidoreductase